MVITSWVMAFFVSRVRLLALQLYFDCGSGLGRLVTRSRVGAAGSLTPGRPGYR